MDYPCPQIQILRSSLSAILTVSRAQKSFLFLEDRSHLQISSSSLPSCGTVESQANGKSVLEGLTTQTTNAVEGHAEGLPLSLATINEIIDFEMGLFNAQIESSTARSLRGEGAMGGPVAISKEAFSLGMNHPANPDTFNPIVFTLFDSWRDSADENRRSIARGQDIFNRKVFTSRGVKGLNDVTGQPELPVTCSSCHNAPNVGTSTLPSFFDIGISNAQFASDDMPVYEFKNANTEETIDLTDPGLGLITGKWEDLGKFKVPGLRALVARAPYFHDGSARDINAVVDFYNRRFAIGLNEQERQDLAAFLRSL